MDEQSQNNQNKRSLIIGRWIAIGLALGAGLGVVFDNIAIGVGVGLALGAAIGTAQVRQLDNEM